MTDHATFLAAIIARPDDDLPRLIYADWLEETAGMVVCRHRLHPFEHCLHCHRTGEVSNGHAERAEFIRTQVELERTPAAGLSRDGQCQFCNETAIFGGVRSPLGGYEGPCTCECRHCTLRRRERELLGEDISRESGRIKPRYYEWCEQAGINPMWVLAPGFNIGLKERARGHFRRGFVEQITCSWDDWQQHAKAIRAATPLRRVRLTDQPTTATDVRGWAGLSYVALGNWRGWIHTEYPGIEFELPQNERTIAGERIETGQLVTRREDGRYVPVLASPPRDTAS